MDERWSAMNFCLATALVAGIAAILPWKSERALPGADAALLFCAALFILMAIVVGVGALAYYKKCGRFLLAHGETASKWVQLGNPLEWYPRDAAEKQALARSLPALFGDRVCKYRELKNAQTATQAALSKHEAELKGFLNNSGVIASIKDLQNFRELNRQLKMQIQSDKESAAKLMAEFDVLYDQLDGMILLLKDVEILTGKLSYIVRVSDLVKLVESAQQKPETAAPPAADTSRMPVPADDSAS